MRARTAAARARAGRRGASPGAFPALVGAIAVAAGAAGCGGGGDAPRAGVVRDEPLEHIHGVASGPGGAVLVATHNGLFRAPRGDARATPVGAMRPDLMGFSVASRDRFIASGHPDARQKLPPHLGLMESRDGGRTWSNVSLLGRADLHVLRASGRRVYGYDGVESRLLMSTDGGKTWRSRGATQPIIDIAIDPQDADRVLAVTEGGLTVSRDAGRTFRSVDRRFVGLLGWAPDGKLFRIGATGELERASAVTGPWRRTGAFRGQPVALSAGEDEVLVATADATVVGSEDGGRTWRVRARSS